MKNFQNNLYLRVILIFVIFFSIFLFGHLLKQEFWSIDDPYYHAKHSALIAQTGNLTLVEPWMEFHFLNYAPNDPWWGFHLWQAVFIHFFGVFLGVKIASAFLIGLFFAIFYFILKKFSVRHSFIWISLVFISSSYFQYRIFLERPQILGIILLPLFSYFLINPVRNSGEISSAGVIPESNHSKGWRGGISNGVKKKYYAMACLAGIFAILYHLFLSLFFLIFLYYLAEYYQTKKIDLKIFIFTCLGIFAGILIHPNSLNYIYIVFVQFVEILYLRFTGVNLGVGGELYPSSTFNFIFTNFLLFVPFCLAIVLFLSVKKIKENRAMVFYFLVSIFWFFVAFIIARGGDFWVPFGWLFVILVFEEFSQTKEWLDIKNIFCRQVNLKIVGFFFFVFIFFVFILNTTETFFLKTSERNQGLTNQYMADANNWLKNNTPENSIIFYNDWSLWPTMFFNNDYNRYITGIDPTFLYEYDHRLSWIWKNISYYGLYCDKQEACLDISPRDNARLIKMAIKEKFRSDYILLENYKERPFAQFLASDKNDFKKVFNNGGVLIYEIVP